MGWVPGFLFNAKAIAHQQLNCSSQACVESMSYDEETFVVANGLSWRDGSGWMGESFMSGWRHLPIYNDEDVLTFRIPVSSDRTDATDKRTTSCALDR